MIHCSILKPARYFNFSKLSDSPVNTVYLSGLCMMSVPREKICKDKQNFTEIVIDRFGRDSRCLQLLFLTSGDKSY